MREINMEMWEIEVGMREIDTAQKIKLSIKHFFSINEIKVCKIQFSFFAEIEKKKTKTKKKRRTNPIYSTMHLNKFSLIYLNLPYSIKF